MTINKTNIPNLLTISRFFIAPLTIIFALLNMLVDESKNPIIFNFTILINAQLNLFSLICFCFFFICVISDFLDGFLARKWNVISEFGKVYDPVADKVVIVGILLVFLIQKNTWFLLPVIMIFRDLIMDTARIYCSKKKIIIPAITTAKWKTSTQMISIMMILLFLNHKNTYLDINWRFSTMLLLIPTIFSCVSFIQYFSQIKQEIKHNCK